MPIYGLNTNTSVCNAVFMTEQIVFHVGDVVRKLRIQKGLGLVALAKAAQTDKGTISKIERGASDFKKDTLERIAVALGLSGSAALYLSIPKSAQGVLVSASASQGDNQFATHVVGPGDKSAHREPKDSDSVDLSESALQHHIDRIQSQVDYLVRQFDAFVSRPAPAPGQGKTGGVLGNSSRRHARSGKGGRR